MTQTQVGRDGFGGFGAIPEAWLVDAPLFIDDQQIKSLYNAVALPEFESESVTVSTKDVTVSKWSAGGQVEIAAGESLLAKVLVGLSGKVTAKADRGGEKSQGTDESWKLIPVDTPERRLLSLAIHYAVNLRDRVWSVQGLDDLRWLDDPTFAQGTPKPLIFLDIEPDFPIVPMAAELPNGNVVLFFNQIAAAVKEPGSILPPQYPGEDELDEMNRYWDWFQNDKAQDRDTSQILMHVVEDVIGSGGRPRWIDYRVPLGVPGSQNRSLHLHLKGREIYDTGDFAYQLAHRGRKHGFRVVGTLKAGPALNVLALYEK